MDNQNRVVVKIYGQEYTISGDQPSEHIIRIAEYVEYLEHPGKLLWTNFLIGIARGLGSTLGLAIVLGILVYFMQNLITLNLPLISDWIANFITMIQDNYNIGRSL